MSRPRSVVEGILGRGRVSLAVTALPAPGSAPVGVLGMLPAALDRRAEIPFKRRRQAGPEQPRARDRSCAESLADLVCRLDDPAPPGVPCLEHAQLLALAEPGRPDAQQADALAAH